jgi:chorismate synthase
MEDYIREIRNDGRNSYLHTKCTCRDLEGGIDKLHAELGKTMLSINAVKGFEVRKWKVLDEGSDHNDL